MKKFIVFTVVFFSIIISTLVSCIEKKNETIDKSIYHIVKNGINFDRNYFNNEYVRIISDSMCFDTSVLTQVVYEFGYDSLIVYFHVNGLSEPGQEYGIYMYGSTSVNLNAPKTKYDYILKKRITEIDKDLVSCDLLLTQKIENIDVAASIESDFSNLRNKIIEYSVDTNAQVISKTKNLKSKLSKVQSICYPKMRIAYSNNLKNKLWSEDIDVKSNGKVITFTGGIFAANKNKEDMYNTILPMLEAYRFKRVNFKWYEYDDKYTYWDIESKEDKNIE